MLANGFSDNDALLALLTVESLVFAALSVAVAFTVPSNRVPNLAVSPANIGRLAAGLVSLVAFGATMAWWSIFLTDWPEGFRGSAIAVSLLAAIVGQPVLAWAITPGLRAKK